ncbi:MAG: hypothetical protein JXA10_20210 [Anaerolineae bacterium]|nr:hypothetical protein [Anaerolineae bacterium]
MVELISFDFDHEKQTFELVVLVNEKEIRSTAALKEVIHSGIYTFQWGDALIDELDSENLYVLHKIAWASYKGQDIELPIRLNTTDGLSTLPEDYR